MLCRSHAGSVSSPTPPKLRAQIKPCKEVTRKNIHLASLVVKTREAPNEQQERKLIGTQAFLPPKPSEGSTENRTGFNHQVNTAVKNINLPNLYPRDSAPSPATMCQSIPWLLAPAQDPSFLSNKSHGLMCRQTLG